MIKYIALLLIFLTLSGCIIKSTNNSDLLEIRRYNPTTQVYEWDHWDYYIDALKNHVLEFKWCTAIFVYLISNIEFYESHPEETNLDELDRLGVRFIIFRVSY